MSIPKPKYKLVKWYPGLPAWWKGAEKVIAEPVRSGYIAKAHTKGRTGGDCLVAESDVEENPEYWKLQTSQYKMTHIVANGHSPLKGDVKEWSHGDNGNGIEGVEDNDYWDPHTVKRQEDGTTFSIGTHAKYPGWSDYSKIHGITKAKGGDLYLETYAGTVLLSEAQKSPFYFKTKDGEDIYNPDYTLYVVWKNKPGTYGYDRVSARKYVEEKDSGYSWVAAFAGLNGAKSYIDEHQKIYSKTDIQNAIDKVKDNGITRGLISIKRLSEELLNDEG